MTLALEDLTVIDLSHALAGPIASTMLADYGATVLKIEAPGQGDIARGWGPPFHGEDSAYFTSLQRNKKSLEIDLKHPEGRELLLRLADGADVVLENFRVGTVDRLGVGYEAVRARNPRIVYCSVSGFGQDGPYRDRAAMDLIVQAESGMISLTGEPGGGRVRAGVSIADLQAGMNATIGILMALHARHRTGEGQYLDVSMLEGQLTLLDHVIGIYMADRVLHGPMGTAYLSIVPYQTFRTKTEDLALAVGSNALWRAFCPIIGAPELTDDPRFATNAARVANRATLVPLLQEIFLRRSYAEWEAILRPAGIPVGAINGLDRVVEHPQVKARGVLCESGHPAARSAPVIAPYFRMSGTPGGLRSPAPLLGQHTDAVLEERLGLGADELARLRARGVIGCGKRGDGRKGGAR
ncbi:MAG TPA: CaiB/BaiF CoA-transferase family protein [Anaeromyxobacter sp.]|nr:CaiB/BaiF CoA-transferase family protein [Anaeromyxobacter sp.]